MATDRSITVNEASGGKRSLYIIHGVEKIRLAELVRANERTSIALAQYRRKNADIVIRTVKIHIIEHVYYWVHALQKMDEDPSWASIFRRLFGCGQSSDIPRPSHTTALK